ncbi:methionine adenosyltransferase [Texas Phoenix palm phytoplasma]|uniref:Methionine adenosyltransferase n=1 Tax=Texas Phoenix palm phytoplasma TaxID=176709 RepID=A0ABS5BJC7_9MOLU|nr:methionine adenosyltransferase [Texas Phoenix palm phytoplasma]MBP3059471.1 methionine adenosyltransferase [Texas Phoenix palm phytoplasma]
MQKFSTESVTKGHPDKIADQISDALLDYFLKKDPEAKIAIETLVTKKTVMVLGEIKTNFDINQEKINSIIRKTVKTIGYDRKEENFSFDDLKIINLIHEQSEEINKVVRNKAAGDQGVIFGYATNETPVFLPLSFYLTRNLSLKITELREKKILPFLRPDGKVQITFNYDNNNKKILSIDSIIISIQHEKNIQIKKLKNEIMDKIIKKVINKSLINEKTKFYINPSGNFTNGGPNADTGLTGRKIIQDAYGSEIRHGGGCFSGKDPSKVDRSAAYMARYLAKNIVASGICNKCEIQISYCIGIEKPVGLFINTFQTNKVSESLIKKIIEKNFDLSPEGIKKKLNLTKPIFQITAREGHFGREDNLFSWEKIDQKLIFQKLLKKNN